MRRSPLRLCLLASAALAASAATTLAQQAPAQPAAPATPELQEVARFDHQVTGVTVARDGRIFVNFPRWTEDSPVSVAEVGRDGSLKPFPMTSGMAGATPRKTSSRRRITGSACRA